MGNEVNVQIGKDLITPIVESHIKNAIAEVMGGKEKLIDSVLHGIMHTKCNASGVVSSSSYENKFSYVDVILNKQLTELMKIELDNVIQETRDEIKSVIIKKLQTKKGSELIASALLDGLSKTLQNKWYANIKFDIIPKTED